MKDYGVEGLKFEGEDEPALKEPSLDYRTSLKSNISQITAVMVKNLVLFTLGLSTGFPTIIIPAVMEHKNDVLKLTPEQLSWVGSLSSVTVPLGCIISGPVMDSMGRRRAMQMVNIPFIVAFIMSYYAQSVGCLYSALVILGIAGGFLEAPVLSYVAEVTQPHLRGILSTTSTMTLTAGMVFQFLLGIFFTWREVALFNTFPPVCAFICLFFIPESPHWLIQKNRIEDSKNSLRWLRGWTKREAIEAEFEIIRENLEKEHSENQSTSMKASVMAFMKLSFFWPLSILTWVFFMVHFNGTVTLVTYAVLIFDTLMVPIDSYYATLILGIVQILGSICCASLVNRLGKRKISFITSVVIGICFGVVATYTWFFESSIGKSITELETPITDSLDSNGTASPIQMGDPITYLPVIFLIVGYFFSACGMIQLPWILIGEVFPYKIRSTASGIAAALGYVFTFLTNKIFFDLIKLMSLSGLFYFYCFISFFGTIVLHYILPETEGYTLNAISDHFAKIRKLPNKVNRRNHS